MTLRCVGCGVELAEVDGPVHRYLESSPACWAAYGEVLERQYSDPAYDVVHGLTVDAYAVQHPGRRSPQTIQSAAVHLIRLRLILEVGVSTEAAIGAMQAAASRKGAYHWLEPPAERGARTIADVRAAPTPAEHAERVRAWALDAWRAWAAHHHQIRAWLPAVAAPGRRS
jgi:hypothetical protein